MCECGKFSAMNRGLVSIMFFLKTKLITLIELILILINQILMQYSAGLCHILLSLLANYLAHLWLLSLRLSYTLSRPLRIAVLLLSLCLSSGPWRWRSLVLLILLYTIACWKLTLSLLMVWGKFTIYAYLLIKASFMTFSIRLRVCLLRWTSAFRWHQNMLSV
jgi:hypothetical protein